MCLKGYDIVLLCEPAFLGFVILFQVTINLHYGDNTLPPGCSDPETKLPHTPFPRPPPRNRASVATKKKPSPSACSPCRTSRKPTPKRSNSSRRKPSRSGTVESNGGGGNGNSGHPRLVAYHQHPDELRAGGHGFALKEDSPGPEEPHCCCCCNPS